LAEVVMRRRLRLQLMQREGLRGAWVGEGVARLGKPWW
jgi:hypothetical protein